MRLAIQHNTAYRFEQPVRGMVQSLRLQPTDCENQRVLEWSVSVDAGHIGAGFRDGAGDWVQTVTVRDTVDALTVSVQGVVETLDQSGVLRGLRETIRPEVYLRGTKVTWPGHDIRALAQEVTEGEDTKLAMAHALARTVSERVKYVSGSTDSETTAQEALEQGEGVCQDHAHLLIALAISVDMPARYVTGYLNSQGETPMTEASHAWAEVFVDDLGWVGFDPANGCCPGEDYVRLGSGLDALDAAPIRGLTLGESTEHLDVSVTVGQVQQQ